ncbi:hypothetical protein AAFF_G00261660 [Aldrovandia affinis]|uniref:IRS-type PTB domain-containing protein n=1 Tax=Aldrovandia affinis TaxID=143900 RepID=A0AAD7W371_9TELE|nr:hypothetical protein AAFF_G00261660 [Aldrovandia affinis]
MSGLVHFPTRVLCPQVMFSFEAGRRCESGPGNFTFETKQGNEIFAIVEGSIREQKAQAEENRQSCPSLDPDCPALQLARATIAEGNRDAEAAGDSGGSKPGSADGEDHSSLYSEPADSVRLPPSPADGLYSDPVDSIKAPHPPAPRKPEPLYSDIYDRVSAEPGSGAGPGAGPREHIYDEPEGRGVARATTLYDEAWRSHEPPNAPTPTPPYPAPAYGKHPPPPRTKGPRPLPKPTKGLPSRNVNNNNSSSSSSSSSSAGGKHVDLYSQVSRHKPPPNAWYPHSPLRTPDIIYDNLGDV